MNAFNWPHAAARWERLSRAMSVCNSGIASRKLRVTMSARISAAICSGLNTDTWKPPVAVLPRASRAEQVTDVERIWNVKPEAGVQVTATAPLTRSVADAANVTTAPAMLVGRVNSPTTRPTIESRRSRQTEDGSRSCRIAAAKPDLVDQTRRQRVAAGDRRSEWRDVLQSMVPGRLKARLYRANNHEHVRL